MKQSEIQPQKSPAERQERILAAAVEEFARRGYAGASTNQIAQSAQVAKGLIFRYFGSKEGLFEAALDQACDRVFEPCQEPLPADPFLRLEAFLVRRAERIAEHPVHARLIAQFRGHDRRILTPPARQIDQAYERLHADFRQGVKTGVFRTGIDPGVATELLVLVAEGLEAKLLEALNASPAGHSPESAAAGALHPTAVRERVQTVIALLQKGIYRPGASARQEPARTEAAKAQAYQAQPTQIPAAQAKAAHAQGARTKGALADQDLFAALSSQFLAGSVGDQRRDRILQAAQEIFADRGYEGASAEAIAAQAGVAKGLIFHHFGSKADLYLAAVADAFARISTEFFQDAEPPSTDLFQRLLGWTRRKILIFKAHPTLYRLAFSAIADPPAPVREALRRYVTEGIGKSWALILEGIDTAPFRPEVQPAEAMNLVMTVLDTVSDREVARLRSAPQQGLDLLPRIADEIGAYLELLKYGLCP